MSSWSMLVFITLGLFFFGESISPFDGLLLLSLEILDAPNKVLLIRWYVNESWMRIASPPILDEHFSSLDHLDVQIFLDAFYIDGEVGPYSCKCLLDILCISLELVGADSVINLGELFWGIVRCSHFALVDKELLSLLHLGVNGWVVIQCVQDD